MYLRHLQLARMMSADIEGSGGSQTNTITDPDDVKDGQKFSHEYVRELRAENRGWRLKASEMEKTASSAREAAEKAAADLKATSEKAKADLDNQVKEVRNAADARVVRYALHAAAKTAGMMDYDGLKLLDTSTVKVGEDGEGIRSSHTIMASARKTRTTESISSHEVLSVPWRPRPRLKRMQPYLWHRKEPRPALLP